MTTVLGINAFHGDAAACLLRDGVLVAAAEEERFRRVKHWAGFPAQAIAYCLEEAGIDLAGVDHVAVNQDSAANLGRKVAFALARRPDVGLLLDRIRHRRERAGIGALLQTAFPDARFRGRVHAIEHHVAHLASAFHASSLAEASVVSVDGFGDFASAAWGRGGGTRIDVDGRVHFPHSLGIFYQAITQFLGFPDYGDEYKVMGLAAYGEPAFLPEMRRIVRLEDDGGYALDLAYFRHHRERIEYEWDGGTPGVGTLYAPALSDLLGPPRERDGPLEQRHRDLACSAQRMYEDALFHLLGAVHRRHGLPAVALAGGCAMNSLANGKVTRHTPFTEVFVQPAAGDAGGALGAAYAAWHALGGTRVPAMTHAYWGPAYDDGTVGELLRARTADFAAAGCRVECVDDEAALCGRVAAAIADAKVVGWFQGRMEWGPRALGNRSILGDPRRADMKDILNVRIKRREPFRPFAPSILREAVPEWFEQDGDVPFMTHVFPVREDRRARIPAVTHADGTGRLQTVRREDNPRYYRLIAAFRDLTGVPMVLNTSFNESEPIACTPDEALACFLRTRMDVLVLGTWVVTRDEAR